MKVSNRNTLSYMFYARVLIMVIFAALVLLFVSFEALDPIDPLPSWKNGKLKKDIISYVTNVTKEKNNDFIKEEDRIAVFDNDGTLWQEQPTVEAIFVMAYIKNLAKKDPSLRTKQPYKAALEGDLEYLRKGGPKVILELAALTHANKSNATFEKEVKEFLDTAKHPKLKVPYTKLAYQPMVELVKYLQENKFKVWICSGGSVDFMRTFSNDVYGIPSQQVIGSEMKLEFIEKGGDWVIWRKDSILAFNDKKQKPVNISNQIGKVPVFAVGNERNGGDVYMLTYSQTSDKKSFQMIVNHDDAVREFAYQEKDPVSLTMAKENGWDIVSIKNDWAKVFEK